MVLWACDGGCMGWDGNLCFCSKIGFGITCVLDFRPVVNFSVQLTETVETETDSGEASYWHTYTWKGCSSKSVFEGLMHLLLFNLSRRSSDFSLSLQLLGCIYTWCFYSWLMGLRCMKWQIANRETLAVIRTGECAVCAVFTLLLALRLTLKLLIAPNMFTS